MDILAVTWDAGGNLPPMFGLGHELVRRGHTVRCLAPEALRAGVAKAGMELRPLTRGAPYDPRVAMSDEASQRAQGAVFFGEGYGDDVTAEIDRAPPDAVVIDCFLVAAQAAAAARGIPTILLAHTPPGWFLPFWNSALLPPTNAARRLAGVPLVGSAAELWSRAERVIAATVRQFDEADIVAAVPNLIYSGPIFEASTNEKVELESVAPRGDDPLVVVGLSTTFMEQEQLLGRVIEALARMKVRGVVTAGPAVDVSRLPTAPNLRIHRWVPHTALLEKAALVITHGGQSTVARALSQGVPLLCVPLGRDQGYIARRVEELGAGLTADKDASADTLADRAATVLQSPEFYHVARRIVELMASADGGAVAAATEVETIARG